MHKPLYYKSSFDKQQSTPTQWRLNDNQRHLRKRMSQSHCSLEHKLSQPIHSLFICHCTQVQSFILKSTNVQWQRQFASIHGGNNHWWCQSIPLTIIHIESHNGNNNYGNDNSKCQWQDLVCHCTTILYCIEWQQQNNSICCDNNVACRTMATMTNYLP